MLSFETSTSMRTIMLKPVHPLTVRLLKVHKNPQQVLFLRNSLDLGIRPFHIWSKGRSAAIPCVVDETAIALTRCDAPSPDRVSSKRSILFIYFSFFLVLTTLLGLTICPKGVGHERDSRSNAGCLPASVNRSQHRH